jgi:peptide methionine sulfoxide reductase MsrA
VPRKFAGCRRPDPDYVSDTKAVVTGQRDLLRKSNRYHQQYLFKVPNGYCGIGGTGLACPVGVAKTEG